MVFIIISVLTCAICNGSDKSFTCCCSCKKNVHSDDCSVDNPNSSRPESNRICLNCFRVYCKKLLDEGHNCLCHVCSVPINTEEDELCYRCEKITHVSDHTNCGKRIRAFEKQNERRFICSHCLYALSNILFYLYILPGLNLVV